MAVTVKAATPADAPATIDTIVLAFSADPVARWCWPEPHRYLTHMPGFVQAFAGRAFQHGGAYCTDDQAAAALWLLPGVHADEDALGDILQRTLVGSVRADLLAVMGQLATYHPNGPHWYLPMIGVDPTRHGQGYGAALMTHALEQCDRAHVPAYLESTNPRNTSLYLRHGFQALARVQVGGSPPFTPMRRPAR
jgi:GNAT superfamily N-acetyltransferase